MTGCISRESAYEGYGASEDDVWRVMPIARDFDVKEVEGIEVKVGHT